jgi:hypothetical protein
MKSGRSSLDLDGPSGGGVERVATLAGSTPNSSAIDTPWLESSMCDANLKDDMSGEVLVERERPEYARMRRIKRAVSIPESLSGVRGQR